MVHEVEGKKPPQNIKAQSETASADIEAMANYSDVDKKKNEGEYTEQQTFKVDETSFYWKKIPSMTFTDREERSVSGFKGSKDRLTLLLGTNAVDNLKLKPVLIYHSENSRALE